MSASEADGIAELKRELDKMRQEQVLLKQQYADLAKSVPALVQKRSAHGDDEPTTASSSTSPHKKYRPNTQELHEEISVAIEATPMEDMHIKLLGEPTKEAIVSNLQKCTVHTFNSFKINLS